MTQHDRSPGVRSPRTGLGLVRDALLGILFIGWFGWAIWLVVLLRRGRLPATPG